MKSLRPFLSRLAAFMRPRQHDREIEHEIASHLEEATDEYVSTGTLPRGRAARGDARLWRDHAGDANPSRDSIAHMAG